MNESRSYWRLLPGWTASTVGFLLLAMSYSAHAIEARVRAGFEAGETTWVGQQVGLNVDIMTSGVRFSGQRIRLPEVPGALILEDAVTTVRLNEQIDGESWQVLRYIYPMFVQREGRIDVKSIIAEFNVYESFTGEPVAFDKASTAMSLQVKNPPGVTDARMLVTTSDFSISVSITPEPDSLIVGDALTQTVTRRASDVSGMAFAPIAAADVPGIATYPKAPDVDDSHNRGVLTGTRVDSVTYVLEQPGEFEIPEVQLPWWNPRSGQLNTETIPALSLIVGANPVLQSEQDAAVAPLQDDGKNSKRTIALALAAIAVLVFGVMFVPQYRRWLARRRADNQYSEPVRFKKVIRACSNNDPAKAYNEYYRWLAAIGDQRATICSDNTLGDELIRLQNALVHKKSDWRGRSFAAAVRKARQKKSQERSQSGSNRLLPALNPVQSARLVLVFSLVFAAFPHPAAGADATSIIRDGEIEIEVFVFGEGQNTLIIAAGNARPAAQLDALAQSIAASGIRVVTYNYRSIGASKGPIVDTTLHDFAGDVWRIADALGLEQVHLAGKTYGNRVMRTAAANRPDRVLSVILIGAGGDVLPSEETQALYRRYIDPNTSQKEWQKLQGELMFAPGNEHLASQSAALGSYPELAAAQVKASDATPKSEWASGGSAPMLILTCLQDRVAVPENALNLAKSRANTWVVGIPQCGHNMLYERPDDLRRLIVEYITQQ